MEVAVETAAAGVLFIGKVIIIRIVDQASVLISAG
jgi:hypothetical protein